MQFLERDNNTTENTGKKPVQGSDPFYMQLNTKKLQMSRNWYKWIERQQL